MKKNIIPYGPKEPTGHDAEQLRNLGVDLNNLRSQGRYYYITLPDTGRIHIEENRPVFDKVEHRVFYNDIEVINVNQKTAMWDPYIFFKIFADNVQKALEKNAEISEQELGENYKNKELTHFQEKVKGKLDDLKMIVFEGGAARGYATLIGENFKQFAHHANRKPTRAR